MAYRRQETEIPGNVNTYGVNSKQNLAGQETHVSNTMNIDVMAFERQETGIGGGMYQPNLGNSGNNMQRKGTMADGNIGYGGHNLGGQQKEVSMARKGTMADGK